MKAGIKDLQLYGMVRVELRPLLKEMPLVGCVSFYFLNSPAIEFNLTNLADILDMPGLRYCSSIDHWVTTLVIVAIYQ